MRGLAHMGCACYSAPTGDGWGPGRWQHGLAVGCGPQLVGCHVEAQFFVQQRSLKLARDLACLMQCVAWGQQEVCQGASAAFPLPFLPMAQAVVRSLTVKSTGPTEGGAITFENTPAAGSSFQRWALQPKAADATADGYASLVLSSDTNPASGQDALIRQIVIRNTEPNQAPVTVNGEVSLKAVGAACAARAATVAVSKHGHGLFCTCPQHPVCMVPWVYLY